MGSIGGGGRYDDLTGLFGVKGIAGVGISFGVDRIYDVMEELKVFPENIQQGSFALIFQTGVDLQHLLNTAMQLRSAGIACEIFHENAKFDKQFKYAEKKSIPFVVILGEEEVKLQTALVKNLGSGEQKSYSINDLSKAFKR
jgi:histidyl-tRNA synthetase